MLDSLKNTPLKYDKEFAKRENLCTCGNFGKAHLREIRIFEADVSTPCSAGFEEWLSEWGFASLTRRFYPKKETTILTKKQKWDEFKLWRSYKYFPLMLMFKIFYKIMDFFVRFLVGVNPDSNFKWLSKKKLFGMDIFTIYRNFAPIERRFAHELPKPYKVKMQFNQRNFIIGKMIEHPIGSFDATPCVKCGFNVSKH